MALDEMLKKYDGNMSIWMDKFHDNPSNCCHISLKMANVTNVNPTVAPDEKPEHQQSN